MIPAIEIVIERAEGYTWECNQRKRATSFDEANRILWRMAETAPKGGGYDKCDFVVTFADGQTYSGRYDLVGDAERFEHLEAHMKSFLGFYAGRDRPAHLTEERYQDILDRYDAALKAEAAAFLDTYRIGD